MTHLVLSVTARPSGSKMLSTTLWKFAAMTDVAVAIQAVQEKYKSDFRDDLEGCLSPGRPSIF